VTAVIAGSRNPVHTVENAKAGGIRLEAEVLEEIDEVVSRETSRGSDAVD
jgi:aryl-alcohol dehydrogenase-like predicted oxidoreductase